MGDVVQLVQPLAERTIIEAMREITDGTTEGVVIATISPTTIGLRTFGPSDMCAQALRAAIREVRDEPDWQYTMWLLLGDVKARALSCTCWPPLTDAERKNIELAETLLVGYIPKD